MLMNTSYTTDFTVFPGDLNAMGALFGGFLLSRMDVASATLARKLLYGSGADGAVTASMDKVDFLAPGHLNDLVTITCELKSLGKSSMTIKCKVLREDIKGKIENICTAIFIFVSMKDGKPFPHRLSFTEPSESQEQRNI